MNVIEYRGVEPPTAIEEQQLNQTSAQSALVGEFSGGTAAEAEHLRFKAAQSPSKHAGRRQRSRTKRRLRGFLIDLPESSPEARVAFVENGKLTLYDLPAKLMRKAGITLQNQPFEMDEIETTGKDGSFTISYRYSALATADDAYIETLKFDDERKRKRALILKEWGKSTA